MSLTSTAFDGKADESATSKSPSGSDPAKLSVSNSPSATVAWEGPVSSGARFTLLTVTSTVP